MSVMRQLLLWGLLAPLVSIAGPDGRSSRPAGAAAFATAAVVEPEAVRQPEPLPAPKEERQSDPGDAVRHAVARVKRLGSPAFLYKRFVWCPRGIPEDVQGVSYATNLWSRAPLTVRPVDLGILVEIDLRHYAASADDREELVDLWEELAFDPRFAQLVTRDQLELLMDPVPKVRRWKRKWRGSDATGWTRLGRVVVEVDAKELVVARFNGAVPEAAGLSFLQDVTQSFAPIVECDYYVGRVLSTVKDRDGDKNTLYSTVWGGLYHEFAGIKKSQVKGRSDFDQLLIDIGVDVPMERLLARLHSDERAALLRSNVTGKPRRITWLGTSNSRLSVANGVLFFTEDVRDRDVDLGGNPVLTLQRFRPAAFEVIWTRRNGLQGFALFGGNGELLDEADITVAADHRVPAPYSPRLQAAKSCIGCHGPHDGWQPFESDLHAVARRVDVYGDESRGDFALLNRLRGQYTGLAEKPLRRAREDNALAVFYATDRFKGRKLVDTGKAAAGHIERIYFAGNYDLVDAAIAMRDLGLPTVGGAGAVLELQQAVPLAPVDDRILAALQEGLQVRRSDWLLSYQRALERSRRR